MRRLKSRLADSRSGYTLVELLVAIAIIGVLVGLVFMGVQAVRESARRAACQSNLRQIGLGLLNYESTNRILPYGHSRYGFSAHVAILPFVGEQARFDQFKLTESEDANPENESLKKHSPLIYSCPSATHQGGFSISYYGNAGTGAYDGANGALIHWRDPVTSKLLGQLSLGSISDGTSNTSLITEVLCNEPDISRSFLLRFEPRRRFDVETYQQFARDCYRRQDQVSSRPHYGDWIRGDPGNSRYFHVLGPNQPNCTNDGATQEMIMSAASMHRGGVQSVNADGSARWVSDYIDVAVWRSMGSRNNTESELSVY